jgi:AcrR family transcriptional regulator
MARTLEEAPRRLAGSARADRIDALVDAALEELRADGYEAFTVRKAARRAGIGPATAYTYFSSKDHLVAEVCWRFLRTLEPPAAARSPRAGLTSALAAVGDLIASEPALAAAATAAVTANDPDVARIRAELASFFDRYFTEALGDAADPNRVMTLNLAMFGALLNAGMGLVEYADLPAVLADVGSVVVGPR